MNLECKSDDTLLETYLLNRMPAQIAGRIYDQSIEDFENHLLVCHRCLENAELHEALVKALHAAPRTGRAMSVSSGFAG